MQEARILGIAEQVARRLAAELAAAPAGAKAPSCRELAQVAKVSLPTAMKALRLLETEGFLERHGARNRFQVAEVSSQRTGNSGQRLLLIRPSWTDDIDGSTRLMVDRILFETSRLGWATDQRMFAYGPERRRPDRRWDEVLRSFQPTRILVVAGTPVIASWAAATGVPTMFLGGTPGNIGIPTLGVSLSANLARLLPGLLAAGERHISLPLCGYGEEFIQALRGRFAKALEAVGLPFVVGYHVPASTARGSAVLAELLQRVISAKPPGTLIFANVRHFMAALGLMERSGMQIGRNVKVALLTHDPILDWMNPQPACFRYPMEEFHRIIFRWLRKPHGPLFSAGLPLHLSADFVGGCGIEHLERGAPVKSDT